MRDGGAAAAHCTRPWACHTYQQDRAIRLWAEDWSRAGPDGRHLRGMCGQAAGWLWAGLAMRAGGRGTGGGVGVGGG